MLRQARVLGELAELAVDGHEVARPYQVQDQLHFLHAGMPENVHRRIHAAVQYVGSAARHMVDHAEDDYDASFRFVSLKANSSISTLSRTTRSTHLSIPASRCNLARNAARAASSPGSERAAGVDRFTRTAASQADSSLACATTS